MIRWTPSRRQAPRKDDGLRFRAETGREQRIDL